MRPIKAEGQKSGESITVHFGAPAFVLPGRGEGCEGCEGTKGT